MLKKVVHFNNGSEAVIEILKEQGSAPGYFFVMGMKNADQKRAKKANHQATPKVKNRRKELG